MTRITSNIDEITHLEIETLANKENRSFSQMVYLLLQQAIKEKNRKKKVNICDHTPNPRSSNAG